MSAAVPFVVNSSGGGGTGGDSDIVLAAASRDLTGSRLFQFYMESFFKIPKDIKNDIIYCQRALKAHIKVHQVSKSVLRGKNCNKMAKVLSMFGCVNLLVVASQPAIYAQVGWMDGMAIV